MTTQVPVFFGREPPAVTAGGVPPLWVSTHPRDIRPPPGPADKITLLSPTLAHEGVLCQEITTWFHGGEYHAYYSCGNGVIGYTHGKSPREFQANKSAAAVYGGGTGGEAGYVVHATAYVEGDYVYFVYSGCATGIRLARALLTDPATLTYQQVLFPYPGTSGTSSSGNCALLKMPDDTYRLYFECNGPQALGTGFSGWQGGWATSATLTGTYTILEFPISTPWPYGRNSGHRLNVHEDGAGGWIAYSHNMNPSTGLPSDAFAWESPDLETFTALDNGWPIRWRTGAAGDQVADICAVWSDDDVPWFFWDEGYNEAGGQYVAAVWGSPAVCPVMAWDGGRWVPVNGWKSEAPARPMRLIELPTLTYALQPFDDAHSGASANYTPSLPVAFPGNRVRVTHTGTANTITASPIGSDVVRPSNAAITAGQSVEYACYETGVWIRR
jgi:hypothetical protein